LRSLQNGSQVTGIIDRWAQILVSEKAVFIALLNGMCFRWKGKARLKLMNSKNKPSNTTILVAGGTGYIGSYTVVALIAAGYDSVIVDNLSNSKASVLERIVEITGKRPPFYKIDLRDHAALDSIF